MRPDKSRGHRFFSIIKEKLIVRSQAVSRNSDGVDWSIASIIATGEQALSHGYELSAPVLILSRKAPL